MDDFRAASMTTPGLGGHVWSVPDGWQQGKGAFGGLVIGTVARAMIAAEGEPARRLRSISAELCMPAMVGAAAVEVAVLRRGRSTTYVEARLVQAGAVVARASAVLGLARPPSAAAVPSSPPELPPWTAVPVAPLGLPPSPRFASHYEVRTAGPPPFSGAELAECRGWLRERGVIAAPRPLDAPDVLGLLDCWWPCALVAERAPRPMSTIAFTAQLVADPATLDPVAPFAYRGYLLAADDGHSVEQRGLWQGGRLVALNQQTFAA